MTYGHVEPGSHATEAWRQEERRKIQSQVLNELTRSERTCTDCGAAMPHDAVQYNRHVKWHSDMKKGTPPMRVDWCDIGSHPFKAGEPGSQVFTMTNTDDAGRREETEMHTCADHNFDPTKKARQAKELGIPVKHLTEIEGDTDLVA